MSASVAIELGPGYVVFMRHDEARGMYVRECKVVGLVVLTKTEREEICFPLSSLVVHEKPR